MTEGMGQNLIDIPNMHLLFSGSQICILWSGIECQYKCSIYAEPGGVGKKKPHIPLLYLEFALRTASTI